MSSVDFSSTVSLGCSSLVSAGSAPFSATSARALGGSFGGFFHQGFLSVGFAFGSFIGYSDRYFALIQRRSSYLPFAPPCGAFGFDMTVVDFIHFGWFPFLLFCLGHKDGGCFSICP